MFNINELLQRLNGQQQNQFPPRPPMPNGAQTGMMGAIHGAPIQQPGGPSGFDLLRDPSTALPIASALMGGRSNQESFGNAIAAAGDARQSALQRNQAQQKKNKTLEYLQQKRPDLAAQVSAGMPIADAWKTLNTQPKKPSSVQEFEYAKSLGYEKDYTTWVQEKKDGTNVTINNGQSDEYRKEFDKKNAQMMSDLVTGGYAAQRSMVQIDRLEQLLSGVPTGGASAIKQIAGNFGIASEGLDEIQSAQALINQLVPQQRPAGSGPMSDADLELFKQSLPRIINQPGGNAIIIQTMRGIAEYTTDQGKIAQQVASGKLAPAQAMEDLNSLSNPLDFLKTGSTTDAAPKRKTYNPATGRLE